MKNLNENELLKNYFLQLSYRPADIIGLTKQIEKLTEAMTDAIDDDTFNQLSDILHDLASSCNKQIKLIHSAKLLLELDIDEN